MAIIDPRRERDQPLGQRLAWFAGIWAASVGALGLLAYAIRWMLLG